MGWWCWIGAEASVERQHRHCEEQSDEAIQLTAAVDGCVANGNVDASTPTPLGLSPESPCPQGGGEGTRRSSAFTGRRDAMRCGFASLAMTGGDW
jgi:hypothetical protein